MELIRVAVGGVVPVTAVVPHYRWQAHTGTKEGPLLTVVPPFFLSMKRLVLRTVHTPIFTTVRTTLGVNIKTAWY